MVEKFRIPMSKPDFGKAEKDALIRVFNSGWFSQGKITEKFEKKIADYLSSDVTVVNNGSSALMCSLLAHGIKPGDVIAVPAFTFIATASVARMIGARVIPIDIDPETLNMSDEKLEKSLTKHEIKAVIVVDVAGLPVDIEVFTDLAKRKKFTLIEDAAEALGAEYKKRKIGSFDHTTVFSFHIAKPVTTIEGGCIASGENNIIKKTKQLRDHGRNTNERYIHNYIGSNFRITDLQSAIGIEQMKKINRFISRRNKIAREYRRRLNNMEFQRITSYVTKHSHMLFFGLTKNLEERDRLLKKSIKNGVDCRKSWVPICKQPCFPELHKINCENAMEIYNRSITIPIYNSMTNEEIEYVINTLN